jgi:tetratricopeptide (TPR) repeat protein
MAKAGLYAKIVERLNSDEPAYTTSAQLAAIAIDLLIRGKHYKEAIEACEAMIKRFPGSIRLKQLYGLALRREKRLDEANYELNLLLENSHRDTETLGILAAVWADIWEQRKGEGDQAGARDALEMSQQLYAEGFEKVPTDTYTGINAASKAALIGDGPKAAELAGKVLERLNEQATLRGGEPSKDYWERVTEPEALLLQGDGEKALELYHAARVAHQDEKGSIASTATQLQRLLGVLSLPPEIKNRLAAEFQLQLE